MFVWLPEVASTYGPRIDHLFYIILYLTGGSFILTEAVLFYFAFKYRHREGRRSHYTHGNSTVEVVWTVVPAVVLVVLTFMSKTVWDEVRHTWPDTDVRDGRRRRPDQRNARARRKAGPYPAALQGRAP